MKFEDKVSGLRIKKYKGRETKDFLNDVILLAKGEAYEYLLGEVNFCGAKIDLSFRPMIPRFETEYWVALAIEKEKSKQSETLQVFRSLDMFAGSGNVGLAFLKNITNSIVDFIEFDSALKKQIEISLEKNKIEKNRAKVFIGDTFNGAFGEYDVITAVPPYVPPEMKEEVMQELSSESPLSFFDKEDGYYYHKQVLNEAKDFLKEGGVLYLEFDITQREKIEKLAKEFSWTNYSFLKDPYGHEFVIRLEKILDIKGKKKFE